jgi:outer membrane protein assembly factor BamD (BamD/ComL family)
MEQYADLTDSLSDINDRERGGHYLAQTYLWLSRIYEKTDNNQEKARKILHRFLDEFPESSDIDYAAYQLGQLYEKIHQNNDAAIFYRRINKGQWKVKADHALHRLEKQ